MNRLRSAIERRASDGSASAGAVAMLVNGSLGGAGMSPLAPLAPLTPPNPPYATPASAPASAPITPVSAITPGDPGGTASSASTTTTTTAAAAAAGGTSASAGDGADLPPSYVADPAGDTPAGIGRVRLHPDFANRGEVVIVCHEPPAANGEPRSELVGFLVPKLSLARLSDEFAARLPDTFLATPSTSMRVQLPVDDPPGDMLLLLYSLVYGSVGSPGPPRATTSAAPRDMSLIRAYLRLFTLYDAYRVRPYFRQLLLARLHARAGELVGTFANPMPENALAKRESLYVYLRLAHELRSDVLWKALLDQGAYWVHLSNPWKIAPADQLLLGEEVARILQLVEAVRAFGDVGLKGLRVVYTTDGLVGVLRGKDGELYVDDMLRPTSSAPSSPEVFPHARSRALGSASLGATRTTTPVAGAPGAAMMGRGLSQGGV